MLETDKPLGELTLPTLSLFTLAYLLGLILFHQQAEIPWVWHRLHETLGSQTAVLFAWAVLCFLLKQQGGVCRNKTEGVFWIVMGLTGAQWCAGVQSAAHQAQQIPLACHKQIIESEFKLVNKAFRDQGAQTWLIEHTPFEIQHTSDCLKPGAFVQIFVEHTEGFNALLPGQYFQASIAIKPPKASLQLEGFDVHKHWFANQIAGTAQLKGSITVLAKQTRFNPLVWMEHLRLHVANQIVLALSEHPEQALILAMVVGDQGLISPQDREMFSNTGIAHLVAISGLHITLFAMLAGHFAGLLWRCSARLCLRIPAPLAGSACGLLFALAYGLIAGWGIPAQRTVLMLFALFVGQWRGGTQSSWDTFFLALFLTLAFDSWAVLDAGFVLSFGAVAMLIFVTQGHFHWIKPRNEWLANVLKAQYTVAIGLLLPCAMLFNQQSLISPVANALSIPWMSFVSTPLALLGGLLQQTWALVLAADSLALQREWLTVFNELDWASVAIHNQPAWIYTLVAIGCLILILPPGIISRWIGLALVALIAWPAPRPEEKDFWMTLMDVGQGTAIAIQTEKHLLLYDAGPAFNERSNSARRVLLPWMAAHGYRQPDLLMLSHDDADHSGGAPLLINKAPPLRFASSIHPGHPLNQLVQEKKGLVENCHSMNEWMWDGVRFEPIRIETQAPEGTTDAQWSKNNQSCVLKISNLKHSVLLTGDIEAVSEMQLLAQHRAEQLKSTVLVVPHHGSNTSSTLPFLQAVQPEFALVQAGWKNKYDHPNKKVIERYAAMNIPLFNTAQSGAMQWIFKHNDNHPAWRSAAESRQKYWHMHESSAIASQD